MTASTSLRIGCRLRLVTLTEMKSAEHCKVADWLQAEIGYTFHVCLAAFRLVADWLQAEIGYTTHLPLPLKMFVADWLQAEIGYTRQLDLPTSKHVADWLQAEIGYTLFAAKAFGRNHLHARKEIKRGVIALVA